MLEGCTNSAPTCSDPALLRIKSDNPNHDDYERTIDEVSVIGRIIWVGRRI